MNYLKQFLKEHKRSVTLNVLLVLTQIVGALVPALLVVEIAVLADGIYPIGKAAKSTGIRLLDPGGNEVPQGKIGEICIYGEGVILGIY